MNLQDTLQNFLSGHYRPQARPLVMAIVNVTPDSFSGDGIANQNIGDEESVVAMVREKLRAGMDIIDIGGESTRPGATPVSVDDEIKRLTPFVRAVAKYFPSLPISIDSQKPAVVEAMFSLAVAPRLIINDVAFGLDEKRDADMLAVLSRHHEKLFGYIVMHNGVARGNKIASTDEMYKAAIEKNKNLGASYHGGQYQNVIDDINYFFKQAIEKITAAGIAKDKIMLDVGFGFGKTIEDSLALINNMPVYKSLGLPLVVGISRKSFIGKLLGRDLAQDTNARLIGGTVMESVALQRVLSHVAGPTKTDRAPHDKNQPDNNDMFPVIVRVHDVAPAFDMARVLGALHHGHRPDYIIALGSNMSSNMAADNDDASDKPTSREKNIAKNITAAIAALNRLGQVVMVSPIYNSAPQYNENQDNFLNAVVVYRGRQEPLQLLAELKKLEKEFGRVDNGTRHQPRPIDLDIISYGEQCLKLDNLTIPHPLAFERAFVLKPLLDIQPWFVFRDRGCYARDLLSQVADQPIKKI
ncbi:MAG: 2-amino-4-hydroxy-6-hydroxymethyldihydropteridine diphosphokinase [Hydrotalea sp.]|nr:2-amino-4-hydroxy-6-hydroxymethyldihydropteridine diphosphokinase [Hydrotalea sp.]